MQHTFFYSSTRSDHTVFKPTGILYYKYDHELNTQSLLVADTMAWSKFPSLLLLTFAGVLCSKKERKLHHSTQASVICWTYKPIS